MAKEQKQEAVEAVAPVITEDKEATKTTKKDKPEFTPEQQSFMQAKIDEIYAKFEAKAEKKAKEIEQAEKLKGMSEQERVKEELKIEKEKRQALENEKLVNQFKIELTTKGLKGDFADLIPVQDAEKAKKAVDFLSEFKTEIETPYIEKIKNLEEQVRNATLRGTTPQIVGNKAIAPKMPPNKFF